MVITVMIHLAHDAADQHQQGHDNSHQALQDSEACSLLLFLGSDRVQLERVPGVSVQKTEDNHQTEELVRGWQQCLNANTMRFFSSVPWNVLMGVKGVLFFKNQKNVQKWFL